MNGDDYILKAGERKVNDLPAIRFDGPVADDLPKCPEKEYNYAMTHRGKICLLWKRGRFPMIKRCAGVTWVLAALLVITAVSAATAQTVPPTSSDGLSGGRPGYVIGYLKPEQLPDAHAFLPPPPAPGSVAMTVDEEFYKSTRALRDTARWAMAAKDADLTFPNAASTFSCALGMAISPEATPHLNMLVRRVRADASRANDKAKDHHKRKRPYVANNDTSCTPQEKHKEDSYPSGHASIGWAWALVLAEIVPDRADAIFARGLAYGESRLVCGVHWKSDVDAGRLVGAATVSRLHADPVFKAQLELARKEIETARVAGAKSPLDCAAEAKALYGSR
jgi:acid phosphatase (class A)